MRQLLTVSKHNEASPSCDCYLLPVLIIANFPADGININIGAIVGGVCGGLQAVLIVITLVVIVMCCIFVNRNTKPNSQEEPQEVKRVGPVYEEDGPALPPKEMDIELQCNQAYCQVTSMP